MTEWFERERVLADGTPLRDVIAKMSVEVRRTGSTTWHDAIVIAVTDDGVLPNVGVELRDGSAIVVPPNYVRMRKPLVTFGEPIRADLHVLTLPDPST